MAPPLFLAVFKSLNKYNYPHPLDCLREKSSLGKRTHQFKVDNLSRLLLYMLGHKPDEFGLVPDRDGFVTLKELLQAINEEPEWHYVRRSHINEVLMGKTRSLFHAEKKYIRVCCQAAF
jgi:RNA:NAD 2'-phosphotransferase (TPT1/KptA family)